MPLWSSRHVNHSNHVLLSAGCRLVIRLADWNLYNLVPFHNNGGTAAWQAVEGKEGRKEKREGQDIESCTVLSPNILEPFCSYSTCILHNLSFIPLNPVALLLRTSLARIQIGTLLCGQPPPIANGH